MVVLILILIADFTAYRDGYFGDDDLAFAKAYQIWACVEIVYAVVIVVFFMLLSGALLSFDEKFYEDYEEGSHDPEEEEDERIAKLRGYVSKHDAAETAEYLVSDKLGVESKELGVHFLVEALLEEAAGHREERDGGARGGGA